MFSSRKTISLAFRTLSMCFAMSLAALMQGCTTSECSAANCVGCCKEGVCYPNGQCDGNPPPASGQDSGIPGPAGQCRDVGASCTNQEPCCATDFKGNPLSCTAGKCQPTCTEFNKPCNSPTCCTDPALTDSISYYCNMALNKCDVCERKGRECKRDTDCCPGLACTTKPGFPNFKDCQ
jgi:hypothetical protein